MAEDKISLQDLFSLLENEESEPADIRRYFELNVDESQAFKPMVSINPDHVDVGDAEAAVGMAVFNGWSRRYRARLFKRRLNNGWDGPICVSEGDSWFQYPILLDDVIDNFLNTHAVQSLGAAGDLLDAIVASGELIETYDPNLHQFVLISCGGNDLLGEGRLATFVKPFTSGLAPEQYLNDQFQPFLDSAIANFRLLIEQLRAKSSTVRIFTHTYAYAIPNDGPWLGKPLVKKGIGDPALQRAIVREIVDRFHQAMTTLAGDYPSNLTVTDCRTLLPDITDWNDELHPTNAGYTRVSQAIMRATGQVV